MAQVTIYVEDSALQAARDAAARAQMSLSQWFAQFAAEEKRRRTPNWDAFFAELDALHATFRDIRPGDRYALNFNAGRGLTLEVNGQAVFSSPDQELARAYLGIWLSPNGLSDKLRTSLLAD